MRCSCGNYIWTFDNLGFLGLEVLCKGCGTFHVVSRKIIEEDQAKVRAQLEKEFETADRFLTEKGIGPKNIFVL